MRLVILILMLNACHRDWPATFAQRISLPIEVCLSEFVVDGKQALTIPLIIAKKLTVAALSKNIVLKRDPATEIISKSTSSQIALDVIKNDHHVSLVPRNPLAAGAYGIYVSDSDADELSLRYVFIVKAGAPTIVYNDLQDNLTLSQNTIRLGTDQPTVIEHDDAITAIQSDGAPVGIDGVVVEPNNQIVIKLAKRISDEARVQSLVIDDRVKNYFGIPLKIDEQTLSRTRRIDWLTRNQEVFGVMSVLDRHIEIARAPHVAQGFVIVHVDNNAERRADNTSFYELSAHWDQANIRRDILSAFMPQTSYRYLVRTEDRHGAVFVASGHFSTGTPQGLRISEIMVNPKKIAGDSEHAAEYVEVVNVNDHEISLAGLGLHLESSDHKFVDCPLTSSVATLKPHQYALIVSNAFVGAIHGVSDDIPLLRVEGNSLCGGLPNTNAKVITLHRYDGNFIDRYSGYRWHARDGQSVQRIALMGLDELPNYCYAKPALGPTPGSDGVRKDLGK